MLPGSTDRCDKDDDYPNNWTNNP